ncbi:MAG TPA: GH116 family glycosyl hydrolase, partial [Acidobacteriota bacterium]|nr:GH116 family glycosyl hydrolase [Acidobacteriota bacterium]
DIRANRKVSVTVNFLIDLLPMWPAGLGGQYSYWDEKLKAFIISESLRRHSAVIGSPAATRYSEQPAHNLPDSPTQFHIDVDPSYARDNFIPIAIAGGLDAADKVSESYLRILANAQLLYRSKAEHFAHLRTDFAGLDSPEPELDRALEWAKVALDSGFICNPQLGCGQVAGLGLSGTSTRPGFGWFFGGDTFLNSFAVAALGDFSTLRQELAFLRVNQREDGKMMHELSQSGAMIPWFKEYPYGYYHADTTPLYLIAMDNYYQHSGDESLVRESWESLKRAYSYCLSTDADGDGMMDNSKAGLAAVETGTLLNRLATDVYLGGVSIEAHRAISHLARAMHDDELALKANERFEKGTAGFNKKFWNPEKKILSFALTEGGGRSDELTVWPAVSIMFGLARPEYASATLDRLASAEISTDWGARMLTRESRLYDPVSYNNGAVWPFLNGLLAWAEYRSHRPVSGFRHWEQNAGLTCAHSLGFAPELLSGDYYAALDTAVPHQLFSSAGIVTPLLKGMLGFYPAAAEQRIRLEPHLPARWDRMGVRNLRAGGGSMDIDYLRRPDEAIYRIASHGLTGFRVEFSPGFEAGSLLQRVLVNGKEAEFKTRQTEDVHCDVRLQLTGNDEIRVMLLPGLRILEPMRSTLPGDSTAEIKVLHLGWEEERKLYTLEVEGRSGTEYALRVRSGKKPEKVEGAHWRGSAADGTLVITFPPAASSYSSKTIRLSN